MGIYKKDDGYYILDKTIEGERFRKSLRTKNIKQARKRAKVIEKRWYEERRAKLDEVSSPTLLYRGDMIEKYKRLLRFREPGRTQGRN